MSFLSNVVDALQPKQSKPQIKQPAGWVSADDQHKQCMAAIEAAKLKKADDTRRAQLAHDLNTEDRRNLSAQRDEFVAERKAAGRPLHTLELHVLDCEVELVLATRAFERDPGQPRRIGVENFEMSKQASRVKVAARALKAAKEAVERMGFMTSSPGQAFASNHAPDRDLTGYFDHRKHMADTMAAINKK